MNPTNSEVRLELCLLMMQQLLKSVMIDLVVEIFKFGNISEFLVGCINFFLNYIAQMSFCTFVIIQDRV